MVDVPVENITKVEKNNRIMFKGKDPETGDELWKIPKKTERGLVD